MHNFKLIHCPLLYSTDGYVADVYDTTVVMPTYLLAFAVCDFQYKENTTKYGHTVRIQMVNILLKQTTI